MEYRLCVLRRALERTRLPPPLGSSAALAATISPLSPLYLPSISPLSPLYLPSISPLSGKPSWVWRRSIFTLSPLDLPSISPLHSFSEQTAAMPSSRPADSRCPGDCVALPGGGRRATP